MFLADQQLFVLWFGGLRAVVSVLTRMRAILAGNGPCNLSVPDQVSIELRPANGPAGRVLAPRRVSLAVRSNDSIDAFPVVDMVSDFADY